LAILNKTHNDIYIVNFKQFLESSNLDVPDPTELGLTIRASILIVPGPDGKGSYMGELSIDTPDRIGGLTKVTDFYHSIEAAQTALRELLQKRHIVRVTKKLLNSKKTGTINPENESTLVPIEITGLKSIGTHNLKPIIRYGGSWDPEALEKIAGYDPEKQQKEREFFGKLQGAISDFQKTMQSTLKNSRKFGDGPPVSGQWITKQDIELIPDVIKTFGDFKVVVKWNQRPRQIINAQDFHKHYDAITKDSEVKTGDYIKEVWVY
jgi:hypothetical protein